MNLIKWKSLPSNRTNFGELFDGFFNEGIPNFMNVKPFINQPQVNVREENDSYYIEFAAPGMEKKDFNLEVEKDQLVVWVEKKSEIKNEEDDKFTRREFNYSSFKRGFYLPDHVDQNSIQAKYNNGVLEIRIDKKKEIVRKPLTIDVK